MGIEPENPHIMHGKSVLADLPPMFLSDDCFLDSHPEPSDNVLKGALNS